MQAFWMVLASLGFTLMGVCVKFATAELTVAETVFYRSIVVVVILHLWARMRGHSLRTPHLSAHLWRGAVGTTGMVTYFTAIAMIPLATAVTLVYTSPLFMAVILHLWFREPAPRGAALILLLGFIGVIMLLQPTLTPAQVPGAMVALFSGCVAAAAMLNVRRLGQLGEPEWLTVYIFCAFASVVGLVWALATGGLHAMTGYRALLALGMGGFGMVGQLCMTIAYKRGKTLLAANLSYTTVVFASLMGMLLWHETLTPLAWSGMAVIILAGVLMTTLSRTPEVVEPD